MSSDRAHRTFFSRPRAAGQPRQRNADSACGASATVNAPPPSSTVTATSPPVRLCTSTDRLPSGRLKTTALTADDDTCAPIRTAPRGAGGEAEQVVLQRPVDGAQVRARSPGDREDPVAAHAATAVRTAGGIQREIPQQGRRRPVARRVHHDVRQPAETVRGSAPPVPRNIPSARSPSPENARAPATAPPSHPDNSARRCRSGNARRPRRRAAPTGPSGCPSCGRNR